ncbi:hypothetical protein BDV96DRAFT_531390 [Lophiotrema nucula]|uniref:Caspase domain-containing protein n=1 Tax=Lophiotrema nucula TaxID=690887 RepID=A0A6A5YLU4_9PLEO|nr:hypothetical protein BDV96DRAFT_531390 [Lophiotrema nucula]
MLPIYGEGRTKAFHRLHREIDSAQALELPQGMGSEPLQGQSQLPVVPEDTMMEDIVEDFDERTWNRIGYKQADAETMQIWWDKAIASQMPGGYHKVAVLLLKWTDELDELKVRHEIEELETVFRDCFHFHTSVVELDALRKPQHQMNRYLSYFVEQHDGPNNLLIIHYSGHAMYDVSDDQLVLVANTSFLNSDVSELRVSWSKTEVILGSEDVEGDVLVFMDTCYSSNHGLSRQRQTRGESGKKRKQDEKLFELVSACALDTTTAAPGPNSFTRALINALTELANDFGKSSFSTFHLNQRITLNPRRRDTPSQLWSLTDHERHIRLAPLRIETDHNHISSKAGRYSRGYLMLGLPLPDESLNRYQIEFLARNITKVVTDTVIGGRKVEWLGMKRRLVFSFGVIALVILVHVRLMEVVRRTRRRKKQRRVPKSMATPRLAGPS